MKDYNWNSKIILIAEDEDINYFLLNEVLSKTKAMLFRATTGEEIIALHANHPNADLILMDVRMPGMTGFEAAEHIRKKSKIPIIAQTAFAITDKKKVCPDCPFTAYVSKPIFLDKLLELVDTFFK